MAEIDFFIETFQLCLAGPQKPQHYKYIDPDADEVRGGALGRLTSRQALLYSRLQPAPRQVSKSVLLGLDSILGPRPETAAVL